MAQKSLEIKITADSKQAVASLEQSARALEGLGQKADAVKIRVVDMAKAFALGQAAFQAIGAAVTSIFVSLPKAALEAERLGNAFKVLSGSAAAAAAEQKFVSDEAQRLGISLSDAQEAYLKLAAAARGTSLEGEAARKVFSAVAGAAATLGLSSAETSGALLAISQMMSKGSVQAEELRGQLGERIPGAFQIAARAMGVSTSALSEMLDHGQILADDFLPKFAEQLAKEIPGSAETMGSALNRVANTVTQAMQLMGGALADALDKALGLKDASKSLAQSDGVVEFARKSAKAIAALIDVVRELVLFVPNVLRTIGGTIAAVARDIKFVFDIAAAVVTKGVGSAGVAAMKRALDERNAFVAAYNQDLADRWFPKNLTERVDEFFVKLRKEQAQAAAKTAPYLEASLTAEQRKTLDAIRSSEEKLAAEYKAHASNLYTALTSGAIGIEEYNKARTKLEKWYQEQLAKSRRGNVLTRLPDLKKPLEDDIRAMQDALKTQGEIVETALAARLVSVSDYWKAKEAIDAQAFATEREKLTRELAAQEDLIARLSRVKPKDANQNAEIAQKLNDAKVEAANLRAELDALNGKEVAAKFKLEIDREKAMQEIRDAVAEAQDEIAKMTGTETPEMRRAAIERAMRDMLDKLRQDAEGAALADRLIDLKAKEAELADFERKWNLALERMRNAEQSANAQAQAGLITTSQAQEMIANAHRQAASAMEDLLPKMEAIANALGPDAKAKVEQWKTALLEAKNVVDPLADAINTDVKNAFATMFEQIGSGAKTAKEAFRDFARAVIASIQRIAAQKLAEQIFGGLGKGGGGGGIGGFISGLLKFSTGGPVPGTGTGDTVPAMLTPGEFVVRRDAVQRIGLDMLHAINGGGWIPSISMGRLAFASGGLVPAPATAAAPTVNASTRIVNMFNLDDAMSEYLNTRAGERAVLNIIQRNTRGLGG